jgi:hypothetical protein
MQELSIKETQQISAGASWSTFFKIAFTTLVSIGDYIIEKKNKHEKITIEGIAIAAGSGMIEGGSIHKNKHSENK